MKRVDITLGVKLNPGPHQKGKQQYCFPFFSALLKKIAHKQQLVFYRIGPVSPGMCTRPGNIIMWNTTI